MIIWDEGGEFERTGYVAIVTQVHEDRIAIIEQNNCDEVWLLGQIFLCEISMCEVYDGGMWFCLLMKEGMIFGWVIQIEDVIYVQLDMFVDVFEMLFFVQVVFENDCVDGFWFNEVNVDEVMYVQVMCGYMFVSELLMYYYWVVMFEFFEEVFRCVMYDLYIMFLYVIDWVL